MLTAWAAAGIVGPMLVSWLRAQTGGYTVPLLFFAGCFVLNFIIALVLQRFGIARAAARFPRRGLTRAPAGWNRVTMISLSREPWCVRRRRPICVRRCSRSCICCTLKMWIDKCARSRYHSR